jgi:hypothetical protein
MKYEIWVFSYIALFQNIGFKIKRFWIIGSKAMLILERRIQIKVRLNSYIFKLLDLDQSKSLLHDINKTRKDTIYFNDFILRKENKTIVIHLL